MDMDIVLGASTIGEDELDDLRTGYAEWIATCAVANMSGITSPMLLHYDQPANIRLHERSESTDSTKDDGDSSPSHDTAKLAIDDCLSCVCENVHEDPANDSPKNVGEDSTKDVVIEIQGGGGHSKSVSKNNGKRSRKVTSDHSVKNDRGRDSGNIRRVYSLSEVLND